MTFFHLARRGLFGIAVIAAFHSAAFAAGNPFPPTHVLDGHTAGVTTVAVFPDGKRAVTGSRDHTVRIWDLSKAAADRTLEGHQGTVLAVAVSPDGKRVASAGADHLVRVWDPATGDIVAMLQGHTGDVVGLAFLPDGHLLSAAGDGLRRWDVAKEETVWRTPPDAGEAFQLTVSADGKRAAYFNKSPDAGNDASIAPASSSPACC
jgi:WD40 repeat protein